MAFNKAKDISGWAADLTGLNAGGWGLTLSTLDMAKIGQLYLDNGVWEDKQIVSEQWVRLSTQRQNFGSAKSWHMVIFGGLLMKKNAQRQRLGMAATLFITTPSMIWS